MQFHPPVFLQTTNNNVLCNGATLLGRRLTVLPRVAADDSGLGAPTLMVPGLDLDLVGHKSGRVLHHEGVSLHHVLPPVLLHILPPVAHLVLQPGPVVLHGEQWLHNGRRERRVGMSV